MITVRCQVRLGLNRKVSTLDSGIDAGHGKFEKKNKHRALNKRRAWKIWQKFEVFCNEKNGEFFFFDF